MSEMKCPKCGGKFQVIPARAVPAIVWDCTTCRDGTKLLPAASFAPDPATTIARLAAKLRALAAQKESGGG